MRPLCFIALASSITGCAVGDEVVAPSANIADLPPDSWLPVDDAPLRSVAATVWTGSEVIALGSTGAPTDPMGAARLDVFTGAWRPTSEIGRPYWRSAAAVTWTGSELFVWGGLGYGKLLGEGRRYSPSADEWRPISMTGAPSPRAGATAVWTGSEVIVWGGRSGFSDPAHWMSDGARYDPSTDTWSALPPAPPELRGRDGHSAIWTGSEMIVWGGLHVGHEVADGARFDPWTNKWRWLDPVAGAPAPRRGHTAVWTGQEMIVWGGRAFEAQERPLGDGGAYDPATGSWRPLGTAYQPGARSDHTAVWTGQEMIVWGGVRDTSMVGDGRRYRPHEDAWWIMAADDAPAPRYVHSAVWAGDRMVVVGGLAPATAYDGGIYVP